MFYGVVLGVLSKGPRTVLMKDFQKWPEKSFKENVIFP